MGAFRGFSARQRKREARRREKQRAASHALQPTQSGNGDGLIQGTQSLVSQQDATAGSVTPVSASPSKSIVEWSGANRERDPRGMPAIQAAKLEHRAINEGWAGHVPWAMVALANRDSPGCESKRQCLDRET